MSKYYSFVCFVYFVWVSEIPKNPLDFTFLLGIGIRYVDIFSVLVAVLWVDTKFNHVTIL